MTRSKSGSYHRRSKKNKKQIALTFAGEGADIVVGDISDMAAIAQEAKDLGRKVFTV